MRVLTLFMLLAAFAISETFGSFNPSSKLKVRSDGGYEDLVIRVENSVDEKDCQDIIRKIKVCKQNFNIVFTIFMMILLKIICQDSKVHTPF